MTRASIVFPPKSTPVPGKKVIQQTQALYARSNAELAAQKGLLVGPLSFTSAYEVDYGEF